MAEVDDVIAKLRLDISDFTRGLKQAQGEMQAGTKTMSGLLGGLNKSISGLQASFVGAAGAIKALFAGAAVTAVASFIKSTADLGEQLLNLSGTTGVTVEDLSALRVAAQLSATSIEDVAKSLQFMNRSMVDAAQGPGPARDAYTALKITLQDLKAVSGKPIEAFQLIAERLTSVTNVTNRNVISQRLLGKSFQEIMPFLQDFAERGMKGIREESDRLHQTWTKDMAQAADAFGDNMQRVSMAATGMAHQLAVMVIPTLERMMLGLRQVLGITSAMDKAAGKAEANRKQIEDINRTVGLLEAQREKIPPAMRPAQDERVKALRDQMNQLNTESIELQKQIATALEPPGTVGTKPELQPKPPKKPELTGALPDTEARAKAEAEAKKLEAALKKLDQEERLIPLQTALMGESFDEAGQRLKLFQDRLEFIVKFGTAPTGKALTDLQTQFQQLVAQQELSTLDKQLRGIAQSQALVHDDMAAGEATIAAYGAAMDGLRTRLGAVAEAEIRNIKVRKDAAEGEQARLKQGQDIGEAYKAFALGLQQLNDEQAVFSDEGARATQTLQLYTTLFQALIKLGPAAAGGLAPVIAGMKQLQVPDLSLIMAKGARGADLFKGLPLDLFDPLAQKIQEVRAALDKVLNTPDMDIHSAAVEELTEKYKALTKEMRFGEIGHEAFTTLMSGFDDMLTGIVDGTETIGASFDKLAQRLIMDFTRRVLAEMFRPLDDAMINLARKLAQLGLEGVTGWFKGGGEVSPLEGATPAPRSIFGAQHGGLFSKPTLAMLGEAGPEAVVPKDRLEAWMHQAMQGIEPGGSAVTVNVINNASQTKVTTQQKQDPQGHRSLDIMIDEAVAQQLSRSGSASQRALRSVYGTSQQLTGR